MPRTVQSPHWSNATCSPQPPPKRHTCETWLAGRKASFPFMSRLILTVISNCCYRSHMQAMSDQSNTVHADHCNLRCCLQKCFWLHLWAKIYCTKSARKTDCCCLWKLPCGRLKIKALKHGVTNASFICNLDFLRIFLGQCDNMTRNNSHWFFSNRNLEIQYFLILQLPVTQKIWSLLSFRTAQHSQNIFSWLLTFLMQCGSEWNSMLSHCALHSRLPQCPVEFQFTPVSIVCCSVYYNCSLPQCL